MKTGTATQKAVIENYTAAMVEKLKALAPMTYDKAEAAAKEMGKSVRSVIAKCKSEGIEYIAKAPSTKKPKGETKADIVKSIAACLNVDSAKLEGLDKAPTACLKTVLGALVALSVADEPTAEEINPNGTDATENDSGHDEPAHDDEVFEDEESADDENPAN